MRSGKNAKHPLIWIQDFDVEIIGIVEDSITKNSIQTVKNFEKNASREFWGMH